MPKRNAEVKKRKGSPRRRGLKQPEDDLPSTAQEHWNASRIWELLRRNPIFRHKVDELKELDEQSRADLMHEIDAKNPFAALAMRWIIFGWQIFRPLRPENRWGQELQPLEALEMDWVIGETDLDELERLIEAHCNVAMNYNHSWEETPPLFRWLFFWLWEEFGVGVHASSRPGLPKRLCGGIELSLISSQFVDLHTDSRQRKFELSVRRFFRRHHVFAIPKGAITNPKTRQQVKENFNSFLESCLEAGEIAANKECFGSQEQWQKFTLMHGQMEYDGEGTRLKSVRKLAEALIEVEVEQNRKSLASKDAHRYIRDYEVIEKLMLLTFPDFSLTKVLSTTTKKQLSPLLFNAALNQATAKLHAVSPPRLLKEF